jgi:CRISPR-associated protein Csx3
MKIVIGGPPRSGKSCLRDALPKAIARASDYEKYLFIIKGAPDGEGAWFHKACERDMREAISLKTQYKYPINDEFTERVAEEVERCDAPLTGIDVGGRVSDENRRICESATHAILLAGDHPQQGSWDSRLVEWRLFCEELGLILLAELYSNYEAREDMIQGLDERGVLRASVHRLERGEDLYDRPAIIAVANHILSRL